MDALSAALTSVRMTGAIFFNAICAAPWGFSVPPLKSVAQLLAPGTERLVSYHLIAEGRALVRFGDEAELTMRAGDIAIIPHGDPHTVANGSPATIMDSGSALGKYLTGKIEPVRLGNGGELTHIICGFFGCDRHADRLFLSGLPKMIKINVRSDAAGAWLESSIRHLVSEAESDRPGQRIMLSKMSEALFIEALRQYTEQLPSEQIGWLAAARDPIVGNALALLHRRPSHAWTVAGLAAEIGASRSVVAQRFAKLLGESPMSYLARWRLQLASRLLQSTQKTTVVQVAGNVGYRSEASFNRAFKREFGMPPAKYRKTHGMNDEKQTDAQGFYTQGLRKRRPAGR
jgi:AraC-like DNA-binding protein